MRYEREGHYSIPFTVVHNKVSQVINWRLKYVQIRSIYRTDTGGYIYSGDGGWRTAGTGDPAGNCGRVQGEVGNLIYDRGFRARIYDPSRDVDISRVKVRISANNDFEVADEVFAELDRLERELYLNPYPFRRI